MPAPERALTLSRNQIAAFAKDPQTIKQFEKLFVEVEQNNSTIIELFAQVVGAEAVANLALGLLQSVAESLATLALAPPPIPPSEPEPDLSPRAEPRDRLDMLLDVLLSAAASGEILQYDGSHWINASSLAAALTNTTGRLIDSNVALTDGAAANLGTLANAPAAGDPTKWIPIDDNGTTRYIPAW